MKKTQAQKEAETQALYTFDAQKRAQTAVLCGVDEAGRGPLAGDVYAGAVILDPEAPCLPNLNDSKKLTAKQRETLYTQILAQCKAWSVATATVEEIDTLNILNATMLAMQRAVRGLSIQPTLVIIDGNRVPDLPMPAEAIVHGDASSACIAAASILAKVSRDRAMLALDEMYPQYGFAKHKGYGTKAHYEALLQYGPCPAHRTTFLKNLDQHGKS